MAIVVRSGFLAAVASVGAFLQAQGVTAVVEVGWKRRQRQDNHVAGGASRVVFVPSDESGAGGTLLPPKFTGDRNVRAEDGTIVGTVRALAEWERRASVAVWAADRSSPSAAEDEAAQIEATETLLESVMLAIHSAPGSFGSVTWGDATWVAPKERAYGRELLLGFTYRHPVFFPPRYRVFPAGVVARGPLAIDPAPPARGGDT